MGEHHEVPEGTHYDTPETCGVTPGTRITVEYTELGGDCLAMFNAATRVMKLNIAANWSELLAAYEIEVLRAFGNIPEWCCPVIPLRRRKEA